MEKQKPRQAKGVRLSKEEQKMLRQLAAYEGLTDGAMLRMLIRRASREFVGK